jgi:threonine/homoserine/homoserine lactone efflux protein
MVHFDKRMKLFRVLATGLMISFLGTLPLGTLNIAAMQISVSDGIRPALYFVLGALLVEVIYVRVSLVAMNWVRKKQKLFRLMEWATIVLIFALAVSSFYAAKHPAVHRNVLLSNRIHRFWLGVMMSAINPVQIPFWFGWSTALFSKGVLLPVNKYYNFYIVGIGLGTLFGNLVFILGGRLIVEKLNASQDVMNFIIGTIFAITALILLIKLLRKKDTAAKLDPVSVDNK